MSVIFIFIGHVKSLVGNEIQGFFSGTEAKVGIFCAWGGGDFQFRFNQQANRCFCLGLRVCTIPYLMLAVVCGYNVCVCKSTGWAAPLVQFPCCPDTIKTKHLLLLPVFSAHAAPLPSSPTPFFVFFFFPLTCPSYSSQITIPRPLLSFSFCLIWKACLLNCVRV